MKILIKGGKIIDPPGADRDADLLIEDGKISSINDSIQSAPGDEADLHVINAKGCYIVPGLIDMHVHLRQPGHEYKETIKTGLQAAAAGGFCAVCPMANTDPVCDNANAVLFLLQKAKEAAKAKLFPIGAASIGLKGETLAPLAEMKDAGAVAVSDDGMPVVDSRFMRRLCEYAKGFDLPVISHCEDPSLSGGAMNEGEVATKLGLNGIPNAAEAVMVYRDIAIAELTGARIHIAHVSTRQSVELIRRAKRDGIYITCETAPHYFTLTDSAVDKYNTNAKMNPPLRSRQDVEAIREGLADGTIDVIASDHAPHSVLEKDVEFENAAFGIIGLETSLSLSLRLVHEGVLSIDQLVEKMSITPARILGLSSGISPGLPADITIIDPDFEFIYKADEGYSKSRNTPFDGFQFKGRAIYTIVDGRIVFSENNKNGGL